MDRRHGAVLHAASLGRCATRVFAGGSVTVAAAFTNSFYVEDPSGEMACVLGPGAEAGPLHALCREWIAPESSGIAEGMILTRDGSGFRNGLFFLDMESAAVWRAEPYPPFDAALFRQGYAALRRSLTGCVPPATCLASLLQIASDSDIPADGMEALMHGEIMRGVREMESWLACPGTSPDPAALVLLGLGAGLTPTGDDILAGTLLFLNAVGEKAMAAQLGKTLRDFAPSRTNRISHAHLMAAVAGEGAGVFHDVIRAMFGGAADFASLLSRIDAIGHTSGWDALTGLLLVAGWLRQRNHIHGQS